jgi:hypothetical protein
LQIHEPEILFRGDINCFSNDVKENAFQTFFNKVAIEKTLWLDTSITSSYNQVSSFANCQGNAEFLIQIISDFKKHHYRTINSSFDILCDFDIHETQEKQLLGFLKETLVDNSLNIYIAKKSLWFIRKRKLWQKDPTLIDFLLSQFKIETDNSINHELLMILKHSNRLVDNIALLQEEFKRCYKIVPRKNRTESRSDNEGLITELILSFQNPSSFFWFFKEAILNKKPSLQSMIGSKLIEKCKIHAKEDTEFLFDLIDLFITNKYLKYTNFLQEIIIESNQQLKATEFIIKKFPLTDIYHTIEHTTCKEHIPRIIENIKKYSVNHQVIFQFHNGLRFYIDTTIAEEFNIALVNIGIEIETNKPLKSPEDYQIEQGIRRKRNLNLLFDEKQLLNQIQVDLFPNKEILTLNQLQKKEDEWYNLNGYSNLIEISYNIIRQIFPYNNENEEVSYSEVSTIITNDDFLIHQIKILIERYDTDSFEFKITNNQIDKISNWCKMTTQEIDFNKIVSIHENDSFSYDVDYDKFEAILFFFFRFDFPLSKEFLFNSIAYLDLFKTHELDEHFFSLKAAINDDIAFNNRIIENLQNGLQLSFIIAKHIKYVLEYKIIAAYQYLPKYLINGDYCYTESDIINNYYQCTNDIAFLKSCCLYPEKHICWDALNILCSLESEKQFCNDFSLEYLRKKGFSKKSYYKTLFTEELGYLFKQNKIEKRRFIGFIQNAIGILFINNYKDAIAFFYLYALKSDDLHFSQLVWNKYNNKKAISCIKDIYQLIARKKISGYDSHVVQNLLDNLVINFSKQKTTYLKVSSTLNNIKANFFDKDKFYVNRLIDESVKTYNTSLSTPLSFENTLEKVKTILD